MGLKENNGGTGGGNILVVKRGAICLESDRKMDGYEHITGEVDDRPYEKWVKKFGSVDGMVTNIKWYDTEDQYDTRYQGLKITIEDGSETFLLDLPYAGKSFDAFTRFADNVDFSKPVEFVAYPDRERQDSTVFNAKQDGQIIRQKYTKAYIAEHPDECPAAVENKRTGKWNFDDQREWLLDNLLEKIVPNLPASAKAAVATVGAGDRWADVKDPIHND